MRSSSLRKSRSSFNSSTRRDNSPARAKINMLTEKLNSIDFDQPPKSSVSSNFIQQRGNIALEQRAASILEKIEKTILNDETRTKVLRSTYLKMLREESTKIAEELSKERLKRDQLEIDARKALKDSKLELEDHITDEYHQSMTTSKQLEQQIIDSSQELSSNIFATTKMHKNGAEDSLREIQENLAEIRSMTEGERKNR